MYKHLIDKIRQAKVAAKLKERQRRFTDIISDKRSDALAPIFTRLAEKDPTLTERHPLRSSNKILIFLGESRKCLYHTPRKRAVPAGDFEHLSFALCGTKIWLPNILCSLVISNRLIYSALRRVSFQQISKSVRTSSPTRYNTLIHIQLQAIS
jgi:hypothetical protein